MRDPKSMTTHGLHEEYKKARATLDFSIGDKSLDSPIRDNGWFIEGHRSKPISKEKWKELSEFQFDDLPNNNHEENYTYNTEELHTEFELKTQ